MNQATKAAAEATNKGGWWSTGWSSGRSGGQPVVHFGPVLHTKRACRQWPSPYSIET